MKKQLCSIPIRARNALLALLCSIGALSATGQGYIRSGQGFGLSGSNDQAMDLKADNSGNSFMLNFTSATTFPVTTGGSTSGAVLGKYDLDANVLWSRYVRPGTGTTIYYKEVVNGNTVYLLGTTTATDIVTTNGSAYGGGATDMVLTRVDATNGSILGSVYLGGNGNDTSELDMQLDNGSLYITYATTSGNVLTTTGPAYNGGYDHIIQKLDLSGNVLYSTYTGNAAPVSTNISFTVEQGLAYLGVIVDDTSSLVTTDGSTLKGGYDFGMIRLDASGNTTLRKIFGSTDDEGKPTLLVKNGDVYYAGFTMATNYPVTDGSSYTGKLRLVLNRFTGSGALSYSTFLGGYATNTTTSPTSLLMSMICPPQMAWQSGSLFVLSSSSGYNALFPNGFSAAAIILNTTDGSSGAAGLVKLNAANAQVQFATAFGVPVASTSANARNMNMLVMTGKGIITTSWSNGTALRTDGIAPANTASGIYMTQHTLDGKQVYGSMAFESNVQSVPLGNYPNSVHAFYYNDHLVLTGANYLAGVSGLATTKPVANPYNGATDLYFGVLRFCPPMPTTNTIVPLTQNICASGFTQALTGNKVAYATANMPALARVNTPLQQAAAIEARYQWQVSNSPSGPWTSIAGLGTQKDYTPPVTTVSKYYRRVVLTTAACGDDTVSISSVASVIVGANTAPVVTGGIFNTCAGTAVGIAVNVSGGTPPYTYAWDNGIAATTSTTSVTPASNSVYTATVTDNNGCKQVGQAIVNAYKADAGPVSTGSCAGNPVRIGTIPPAGLAGVTYAWTPAAGLDNPAIAQPLATPAADTTYLLGMTIPVTGGGTCTTTDTIRVNVVAAPLNTAFAGPDVAVCKGGTTTLGSAAEAGFTYTWAPGNYLSASTGSTVTFNAGSDKPVPNPFTYSVTAVRNGCTFSDNVTVYALEVDAGKDYCGPRTVGVGDKDPQITGKTFLWQKISGPGAITGATNTATTSVSASVGGTTTYRLTVAYLGTSCSDDVLVAEDCTAGCPVFKIDTTAMHGCPSAAFGPVSFGAVPATMSGWTYSWSASPAGGISATTGSTITLTDNVERTVTLTATNLDNPAFTCTRTVHVNDPSWALPVFIAQDHNVCPGTTVSIGSAAVVGYSYAWTNVTPNSTVTISNPSVTPAQTTSYYGTVTDNLSGCMVTDTATVTVKPLILDPGSNWTTCSNVVVQLGTPAQPGYTYSWSPAVASYQGGTSNTSADPKVLIATSQDFTLTVTDNTTGCTKDSTVHIVVDNSPNLPAMTDTTICPGGSARIGNAPLQNVSYSWSPAAGLSSATVAQPVATPAATQTYTLTVTYFDASNTPACTKTGTVTVNVAAPQITMSDTTICPSAAAYNLSANVSVTGATAYSWTPANLVTATNALSSNVRTNPTTPTTFTLTARDARGCATTASKTITPTVMAPDPGSNAMACVGSAIQLGNTANTGTINWSVAPAIAGTLSSTTAAAPVFTPASADSGKTFTFTVSQTVSGCTSTAASVITVRKAYLEPMAVQTICSNASTTIGVAAQPGLTYTWDPTTDLANPNAASTVVNNVTGTRTYTLFASDVNGCFATSAAVVGVNATPAPTVTIPDVTTTIGVPPTSFNPSINPVPGSYIYNWTPGNQVDNPYIANATARAAGIGNTTYTLAVTDDNGCTSSARTQLKVVQATPLPITLSAFSATVYDCAVRLNWQVQQASGFSHFVLERSNDGNSFTALQEIGFKSYSVVYDLEDKNPGDGRWLYRLKLIGLNGNVSYSKVVAATVKCAAPGTINVYPNPFTNSIHIRTAQAVNEVSLLSLTGATLVAIQLNQPTAGLVQLSLPDMLAPGTYVLRVVSQNKEVTYVKLIK